MPTALAAYLDGRQDGCNIVDRAPLILKDVQTDLTVRID